jgi:sterol 14-demethylase
MDSKYSDGTKNTDDQICGIVLAGLFGGQHTSSITSTWVMLNLVNNPEIM